VAELRFQLTAPPKIVLAVPAITGASRRVVGAPGSEKNAGCRVREWPFEGATSSA
jgi:hypothetical protein